MCSQVEKDTENLLPCPVLFNTSQLSSQSLFKCVILVKERTCFRFVNMNVRLLQLTLQILNLSAVLFPLLSSLSLELHSS